jgi:hypothetical protein
MFYRLIFAVVFLLNLFLIAANSSGAVPFGGSTTIHLACQPLYSPFRYIASHSAALVRHFCAVVHNRRVFRD